MYVYTKFILSGKIIFKSENYAPAKNGILKTSQLV